MDETRSRSNSWWSLRSSRPFRSSSRKRIEERDDFEFALEVVDEMNDTLKNTLRMQRKRMAGANECKREAVTKVVQKYDERL